MKETHADYVRRFQEFIKFPTISTTNDEATDFAPFSQFHEYLEKNYPLVHSYTQKENIGNASLLFHWKSSHPTLPPVLLMGHQDVTSAGDPALWHYPPFSAEIADDCIWGRGTTDCKHIMFAELEAVEALLSEGFSPAYDIYLSYGHNEEVGADNAHKGAVLTAAELARRGVHFECLLDEGGMITAGKEKGYDGYIANISLAEKGFNNYKLYYECSGGHSSTPGQGSALGKIARGIIGVEDNPFPYRLTPLTRKQLSAMSLYVSEPEKSIFASPEKHWNELKKLAESDKKLDAILHTTMAVTMASGSQQANVLPSQAEAVINCRLLQGDTVESVLSYIRSHIPANLTVCSMYDADPVPVPDVDENGTYGLLSSVLKDMYGKQTILVPSLMTGGTDARFYADICDNLFRFGGFLRDNRWGQAHEINEKIPCDALPSGINFFKTFLKKYNIKNQ